MSVIKFSQNMPNRLLLIIRKFQYDSSYIILQLEISFFDFPQSTVTKQFSVFLAGSLDDTAYTRCLEKKVPTLEKYPL